MPPAKKRGSPSADGGKREASAAETAAAGVRRVQREKQGAAGESCRQARTSSAGCAGHCGVKYRVPALETAFVIGAVVEWPASLFALPRFFRELGSARFPTRDRLRQQQRSRGSRLTATNYPRTDSRGVACQVSARPSPRPRLHRRGSEAPAQNRLLRPRPPAGRWSERSAFLFHRRGGDFSFGETKEKWGPHPRVPVRYDYAHTGGISCSNSSMPPTSTWTVPSAR